MTKLLHKETVTNWNKYIAFNDGIKYGTGTSIWFPKKPLKSRVMF